jgi:hypothetical protein
MPVAADVPATAHDLTFYRFELMIGRRPRTCEQWHPDSESAEADAGRVLEEWREGKRGRVVRVVPVTLAEAVERGIIRTPECPIEDGSV